MLSVDWAFTKDGRLAIIGINILLIGSIRGRFKNRNLDTANVANKGGKLIISR